VTDAYVVDSSVLVRWYLDQVGFVHAREVPAGLVAGRVRLEAPELVRWEVPNAVRARTAGRLDADDLVRVLTDLDDLGMVLHPTDPADLPRVLRLAVRQGISMFDAAFVDLALRRGLTLLTADARLVRAVDGLIPTELLRGIGGTATGS
jgi:predicted nucleic acid-binding protein